MTLKLKTQTGLSYVYVGWKRSNGNFSCGHQDHSVSGNGYNLDICVEQWKQYSGLH